MTQAFTQKQVLDTLTSTIEMTEGYISNGNSLLLNRVKRLAENPKLLAELGVHGVLIQVLEHIVVDSI